MNFEPPDPVTSSRAMRQLSGLCKELAELLHTARSQSAVHSLIQRTHDELLRRTSRDLDEHQITDTLSQTILQTRIAWNSAGSELLAVRRQSEFCLPPIDSLLGLLLRMAIDSPQSLAMFDSIAHQIEDLLRAADGIVDQAAKHPVSSSSVPFEFDSFLAAHDPLAKSRKGVYFTPQPLAAFVVRQVDRLLKDEFGLSDGLADTMTWSQISAGNDRMTATHDSNQPFVTVLDPAAGSGVFLTEVIDCVWTQFNARDSQGSDRAEVWNDYVAQYLLPRLLGNDLLLPACATAWVRIAAKLAATSYRFASDVPFRLELADSLVGPNGQLEPVTVVLGNPPFSALTVSGNEWIDGLLRSSQWDGRDVGSFFEVDGQPLGEKKLWLHDDYVKFLRYSQWRIEQAGAGIVGFVTSHGYLDNLTFRGMRQSLLRSFPHIALVDLHGSRKKREKPPNGIADENMFGIDQGTSVGLFCKPLHPASQQIQRVDLWGKREAKLEQLAAGALIWHVVHPTSPNYLFALSRVNSHHPEEYSRGFPLDEIMPVHSTAAVTARDSFVVAFTKTELLDRMREFTDESVSDEELRRRYFSRTRSGRYPPGDTRSWKLGKARQSARRTGDLMPWIRPCLYRPFDRRYVLWTDWMIDWPRNDVMHHMLAGDNLALVTRRQMIPNQPANYFFVADTIPIDGLIRSDNRGSESFFPLFLFGPAGTPASNFSKEFAQSCAAVAHKESLSPLTLFHMIYAQFHSPGYRERYQSELCFGFPRAFVPRSETLFRTLANAGERLVAAHLLRNSRADCVPTASTQTVRLPQRGYPILRDEQLWLNEQFGIKEVPAAVWDFHVGGYQVCKKWLRDRRGRTIGENELSQLRQIVASLGDTISIMAEIDMAIEEGGGWPAAFSGRETLV